MRVIDVYKARKNEMQGWPDVTQIAVGFVGGEESIILMVKKKSSELQAKLKELGGTIDGAKIKIVVYSPVGTKNPYGWEMKVPERFKHLLRPTRLPGTKPTMGFDDMVYVPTEDALSSIGIYRYIGPFDADNDLNMYEPLQGDLSDCGLIASLASMAWVCPTFLRVEETNGSHELNFRFFKDVGSKPVNVSTEDTVIGIFLDDDRKVFVPSFAFSSDGDEAWPPLYEKAFTLFLRGQATGDPDYDEYGIISNKDPYDFLFGLTGWRCTLWNNVPEEDLIIFIDTNFEKSHGQVNFLRKAINPIVASSKKDVSPARASSCKIRPDHAYSVLGYLDSGHIVMRDPFGTRRGAEPISGAPMEPITVLQKNGESLSIDLRNPGDAIFAVPVELFLEVYSNMRGVLTHDGSDPS